MSTRIDYADIDNFFFKEVAHSWESCMEDLEFPCRAPLLEEIYNEYFLTMINYVEEMLEEEFGDIGETEIASLMNELNIDFSNIPPLVAVREVLDTVGLPYEHEGRLYGFAQLALF